MILQLLKKTGELTFERSYPAPIETVWQAWTQPDLLRQWWGPDNTTVPDCEIDLRIGGAIEVVMEAGPGMGRYQGTRWPMVGAFTHIDEHARLSYDARSWTEGEEETSTIHHANDVTLVEHDNATTLRLHIVITKIGPKARMAAFGMKWGYKHQLEKLEQLLRTIT